MTIFSMWMVFLGIAYVIFEVNKAMKFIFTILFILGVFNIISNNIFIIIISLCLIIKIIMKKDIRNEVCR